MFVFIASTAGFFTFISATIALAIFQFFGKAFYDNVTAQEYLGRKLSTLRMLAAVLVAVFLRTYKFLFWGAATLSAVSFVMQAFIYLNNLTPSR